MARMERRRHTRLQLTRPPRVFLAHNSGRPPNELIGADDTRSISFPPEQFERLEWTGRSAANFWVNPCHPTPWRHVEHVDGGRAGPRPRKCGLPDPVANKHAGLNAVFRSQAGKRKPAEVLQDDVARRPLSIAWTQAIGCCNAAFPSSIHADLSGNEIQTMIKHCKQRVLMLEDEIINLDLCFRQGVSTDERAIATAMQQLAANAAAGRSQIHSLTTTLAHLQARAENTMHIT